MPDNKTQVLIELQLEMKKLKGQMKDFMGMLKASQKQIQEMCKENVECNKEILKSLEDVTKAHKKVADATARAEKQKQNAIKATGKSLDDQVDKLGKIAKLRAKIEQSRGGRFFGGMAAGAGLGGLDQRITAQGAGAAVGGLARGAFRGGLNFLTSGISTAYQSYLQYGQALGGLTGLGTPGQMAAGRRGAGGVGGAALGYNVAETAQQARGIGRATGNIGAVYKAQQFARGYGMDVGEAGGYMGMLRQAGFEFGGQVRGPGGKMQTTGRAGSRELTKIIEAGMISGLEKGRIGEFLQGVSSITSQLGTQLPGKINVSGIAAQAAMLGQSKLPGFQGARGMQLLGRLNQAIQRPGGGEAGQSMVMQALGFGKPGGGTRYYEALRTQEKGIQDPRNLPKIMKEVYSQLGDPSRGGRDPVNQEANLAMKEIFGISLQQAEELQTIATSGASSEEQQKKILEIMKAAEPIEKQALKESKKGFLGVQKHLAGIFDKQVAIGSIVAPTMMKLQNLQLAALKVLVEWLPKIANWLKETYLATTAWFTKDILGDPTSDWNKMLERQSKVLAASGFEGFREESTLMGRRQAEAREVQARKKVLEDTRRERKAMEAGGWLSRIKGGRGLDPIAQQRYEMIISKEKHQKERLDRFMAESAREAAEARRLGLRPEQVIKKGTAIGAALGVARQGKGVSREVIHQLRRKAAMEQYKAEHPEELSPTQRAAGEAIAGKPARSRARGRIRERATNRQVGK
jgi:hypothetical protein